MNDLSERFQALKAQITNFRSSIAAESTKIENLYGGYELAKRESQVHSIIRQTYYIKWKNALFMRLLRKKNHINQRTEQSPVKQRSLERHETSPCKSSISRSSNAEYHEEHRSHRKFIEEPQRLRVKRPPRSIRLTSSSEDEENFEIVTKAKQILESQNKFLESKNSPKSSPQKNSFQERLDKIRLKSKDELNSPKKSPTKPTTTSRTYTPSRDNDKKRRSSAFNEEEDKIQISPYGSDNEQEEQLNISPYASDDNQEENEEKIQISPYNSESEHEEENIQISPYQSESDPDKELDEIPDEELLNGTYKSPKKVDSPKKAESPVKESPKQSVHRHKELTIDNVMSAQMTEPETDYVTNTQNFEEEEEEIIHQPTRKHKQPKRYNIDDVESAHLSAQPDGSEIPTDIASIISTNEQDDFVREEEHPTDNDFIEEQDSDGTMATYTQNNEDQNQIHEIAEEEEDIHIVEEEEEDKIEEIPKENKIDYAESDNYEKLIQESKKIYEDVINNPITVDSPVSSPNKSATPTASPQQAKLSPQPSSTKNEPEGVVDEDGIFILNAPKTREIDLDNESIQTDRNEYNTMSVVSDEIAANIEPEPQYDEEIPVVSDLDD